YIKRNKALPSNSKIKEFNRLHDRLSHTALNRNLGYIDLFEEIVSGLDSFTNLYKSKIDLNKYSSDFHIPYDSRSKRIVEQSINTINNILASERGTLKKSQKLGNLMIILESLYKIYSVKPSY
ncbi:MAG: hypothetical protein H8D97_01535, partial [Proteobacteria bacterium]|nr:hypothetical protein [Pseudomonadota bacterium]